ncbi:gluconolactonase [Galbibacter marinus]|uniref:Gluconolactonase n=1 Tax=Galbibacter marinus TaxID=555500 RepID=K2QH49_9FLAO|nr:SMP-30/gluconolactonase/LRE family protein [Galbibacter marinus]EKF54077.1 gluconolactonase [Galbibacter marinus]
MKTKLFFPLTFLFLVTLACTSQDSSPIKKGASLKLVADGFKFTEGPAEDKHGNVYFTDQPNNKILKWDHQKDTVLVFMDDAGRSNGLFIGNDDVLYSCADEKFQLWKIESPEEITVIADGFDNTNFNGPNDLWIDDKGGIYFTDPYYQRPYWERQAPEMDSARVYYLSPDYKTLRVVAEGFDHPNGIIGSVEDKILYVADNSAAKTYVYDILENGDLVNKRLFVEMGSDGMTLDNKGNLYLTGDGVHIYDKNSNLLDHIEIDKGWTSNVTFGGEDFNWLFITALDVVYKIEMKTHGIRWE